MAALSPAALTYNQNDRCEALKAIRFFGKGYRSHSVAMIMGSQEVRFIDSVHMTRPPGRRGVRLY